MTLLFCFFIFSQISTVDVNKNRADKYCAIKKVDYLWNFLGNDIFYKKDIGLRCVIKNSDFTLDIESFTKIKNNIKNEIDRKKKILGKVEFYWSHKASSSLTKQFNISAFMSLFRYFNRDARVNFRNLKSIELELFEKSSYSSLGHIYLINLDLRFTIDGKTVKSCPDITSLRNGTFKITSLFQIRLE